MVLLADGADALWRRLPAQVPLGCRRIEILDFYHAAEHVVTGAKALVGEQAGQHLGAAWRRRLKAGEVDGVIGDLAGRLAEAVDPKAATDTLAYLRTHRHRMGYLERRLDGYQIGSGTIESWCKQMLRRVRGAGMRWSEDGLEAVLALRCRLLEDDWNRRAFAA